MKRFRSPAAVVCGVLCVAGLVAGIIYVYLARVLFEADWFADRAAACLAQPQVSRVVAAQATDQIIAYRRELTAYRPLLLGTLEYVVASAPVRAVVRRAAKEIHAKLISDTGDDILFTVADLGVVARNALAAYPEIAAKIPERAQVTLGNMDEWPWAKKLLTVMRLGNRLRTRAAVGLGLGLLCGAAGVLLTRRKDRYLLRLGLGLAITAFVMAGVFRFGGGLAALFSRTDIGAELVRGIWPVFLGPLAIRLLILGGLGIVLVAAVTSLLEKVEPIQFARQWLGRALHPHVRPGWGFLRGVLLVAAGLVVLYHPMAFLLILAVVAGSVLLYEGVQELFVTACASPRASRGRWRRRTGPGRSSSPAGVIVVGVLAALLIGGGAFWLAKHSRGRRRRGGLRRRLQRPPGTVRPPLEPGGVRDLPQLDGGGDIADWMFPNQEKRRRRRSSRTACAAS